VRRSVLCLLSLVLIALLPACEGERRTGPEHALRQVTEKGIRAHVRFLSHDLLEGRAPGTRGGQLAAEYIASRFEGAGLSPVDGSWFQPVPIVGTTPVDGSLRLRFQRGGRTAAPEYLEDYVIWSGDPVAENVSASGELVFVGYGVTAPEADWNDFEGMDMEGKILLILVNDPWASADEPDRFEGDAMTYYGRWTYKFEEAARQGAAGALIIHTTERAGYPWAVVRGSWSGEQFALPPTGSEPPPPAVEGWLSRETASWVLGMAGLSLEELERQAGERGFSPVATGIQVDAALRSGVRRLETRNVVGVLPGTSRPDEVVVLMAHYDHLGIGEPVNGDSIFNGAYDNASGVGLLLEQARAFAALDPGPARTVLFMATAAEESGLLGAEWYVTHPLFPLSRTAAALNVDGVNLWGETDDMIVMGRERSELGAFADARARYLGVELVPDPTPAAGLFFRSDHFPFSKAGVPSLWIRHGDQFRGRPQGWGRELLDRYTAEAYHTPRDRFSEDFVFDGAVQQGTLLFLTAYDLAQDTSFPNWHEGSEFRAARDRMMAR
jgi:Zn-dependent M28 family amino/carboxypeptidase